MHPAVVAAMAMIGAIGRVLAIMMAVLLVEGCLTRRTWPPPAPSHPAGSLSVIGVASWYGPGFNGHRTSSGSIYNQDDLSAASTLFPLGTELKVTNLANGRTVDVTVNDHGPYVHGRDLDLSRRAALVLGVLQPGTARVRMDVLSTPPGGPALGLRYLVQVGSFTDEGNAQRLQQQLGRYYHDVRVSAATWEDNRYYRVWMGTFADRISAERRALTVTHIGLHPVIIAE